MVNKKSILVFYGSPHSNGYTKTILDYFLSCFRNESDNYVCNTIDCYKRNIRPCVDCGHCKAEMRCIFNDMDDINEHLEKSDILVFASPIYNLSFPAPVKAVIDRMQLYFNARFSLNMCPPIKRKKHAILILTCGSRDSYSSELVEKQLGKIFTVINTQLVSSILYSGTDYNAKPSIDDSLKLQVMKAINELHKLYKQ